MSSQEGIRMMLISPLHCCRRFNMHRCMLGVCWHLLHLVVSMVHSLLTMADMLQSQLISTVLSRRFKVLQFDKLRYLAIVINSDEARSTSKVIKLLNWVSAIGVKHVSIYDMDGVLKQNKEMLLKNLPHAKPWEEADGTVACPYPEKMTLELLSFSDGKEGVAKAASFLCSKYLKDTTLSEEQKEPAFTEAVMADALRAVGCGGPEPDLLLVYGPARCHLGFPPWRLRYTEIVHMGTLKSMKRGAIIKTIHKFSQVHQNYGT